MGKAEYVLGAVLLCSTVAALAATHTDGTPDNWLYHYQTLTTGILALASALLAALLVKQQINQADRLEKQRSYQAEALERSRIESKRETSRAMLPLALTALHRYAQQSGVYVIQIKGVRHRAGTEVIAADVPPLPELPQDALAQMKELAEYVNSNERLFIAGLISLIQILSAKLGSIPENLGAHPPPTLDSYLLDAAEARARTDAFFDWARREPGATFPQEITYTSLRSAAHSIQTDARDADFERIDALILRRAKGDLNAVVQTR